MTLDWLDWPDQHLLGWLWRRFGLWVEIDRSDSFYRRDGSIAHLYRAPLQIRAWLGQPHRLLTGWGCRNGEPHCGRGWGSGRAKLLLRIEKQSARRHWSQPLTTLLSVQVLGRQWQWYCPI